MRYFETIVSVLDGLEERILRNHSPEAENYSFRARIKESKKFPFLCTLAGILPTSLNPAFLYVWIAAWFVERNSTSKFLRPILRASLTNILTTSLPIPKPL